MVKQVSAETTVGNAQIIQSNVPVASLLSTQTAISLNAA